MRAVRVDQRHYSKTKQQLLDKVAVLQQLGSKTQNFEVLLWKSLELIPKKMIQIVHLGELSRDE